LDAKKRSSMKSAELMPIVDDVEQKATEAMEAATSLKAEVSGLKEGLEMDILPWLLNESKTLDSQAARMELRLKNVLLLCQKARAEATTKQLSEISSLQLQSIAMAKHHQKAKGLSIDALYDAVSGKEEAVEQSAFVSFFTSCEKEEGKPVPEEADFEKLFKALADGEDISKELMLSLLRTYMKVTKETVITSGCNLKSGETLRKLDVGEYIELLGTLVPEGEVEDLMRVHCKALKDDTEGWVTISGNNGTTYAVLNAGSFRVMKETLMTESFESETTEEEEPRKLKMGEIVEAWVWPKKIGSGAVRMKCKAKLDNKVGWVTSTDSAGQTLMMAL